MVPTISFPSLSLWSPAFLSLCGHFHHYKITNFLFNADHLWYHLAQTSVCGLLYKREETKNTINTSNHATEIFRSIIGARRKEGTGTGKQVLA